MNEEKGRPMTLREKKVYIENLKREYAEERRQLRAEKAINLFFEDIQKKFFAGK